MKQRLSAAAKPGGSPAQSENKSNQQLSVKFATQQERESDASTIRAPSMPQDSLAIVAADDNDAAADSIARASSRGSSRGHSRGQDSRRALRRRSSAGRGVSVPVSERVELLGDRMLQRCIGEVMQPIKRRDFTQRIELPGGFNELSFEDQLTALDQLETPMVSQVSRQRKNAAHDPAQRKDLRVMCDHIKGNHSTFEICRLNDQNIDDELMCQIARSLRFNVYMQCLQLNNNYITDEGVKELCRAIRGHPTLHTIRLGNNYLSDISVNAFVALMEKNKVLRELNLTNKWQPMGPSERNGGTTSKSLHPCISSAGAEKLASIFSMGCSLTALSLHDQRIGTSGAVSLFEALPKSMLLKLNIGCNQISDNVSAAIKICFSDPTCHLMELIMHGNELGDTVAASFSHCFAINKKLTTLDLSSNRIGGSGMQALASALLNNLTLAAFIVRGNPGDCAAVDEMMLIRDSRAVGSVVGTPRSGATTPMASSRNLFASSYSPGGEAGRSKSPSQRQLLMSPKAQDVESAAEDSIDPENEAKMKKMKERRLERIQANNRRFNSSQSRNLLRDLAILHGSSKSLAPISDVGASAELEEERRGAKSSWQRYLDSHPHSDHLRNRPPSHSHGLDTRGLTSRHGGSAFNLRSNTHSELHTPVDRSSHVDTHASHNNTRERIGHILDANKSKAKVGADLGKTLGIPQLSGLKGSSVVRSGISGYQDTGSNSLYLRVAVPAASMDANATNNLAAGEEEIVPMSLLQIDVNRRVERERVHNEHQGNDYKEYKYLCMFYGDRPRVEESIKNLPPDSFWREEWRQQIQLKYPKGIDEHGSRSYKERIGTLVGSSSPSRSGSPSRSAKGTNRTVVSGDRAITPNATSIRSTLLNAEQQEASGNEPTPVDFDRDAVPPSLRLGDELADACILAAVNKRMTRDTERRQHARKVKRLNRFAFQKPKPTAAAAAASSPRHYCIDIG